MGSRGPAGKRSEERVGHPKGAKDAPEIAIEKIDLAELVRAEVEVPEAYEKWHPVAKMTWDAIKRSGQSIYYEPTDWAQAYLMCESISRELKPQSVIVAEWDDDAQREVMVEKKITQPIKGASLTALTKMATNLLMTEADRRRMQMEIDRAHLIETQAVDSTGAPVSNDGTVDFKAAQEARRRAASGA